jgi:hypothetical protein
MNGNVPDFLVVGVAKAGTTSLHNYFDKHTEICMPSETKELNFWHLLGHVEDRPILKMFPDLPTTYDEYKSHFSPSSGQICGEASPSYLYYDVDTIANLKNHHPNWKNVKIIISLREPIDRIWSHYKFVRQHQLDPLNPNFDEYLRLEAEREGMNALPDLYPLAITDYCKQVNNFLQNFNYVKIVLFDELKTNPEKVFGELTDFLGVSRIEKDDIGFNTYNASVPVITQRKSWNLLRRIPLKSLVPRRLKDGLYKTMLKDEKMSRETRNRLKQKYKIEVDNLQSIIDMDLSHWLKKYE